MDALNTLLRPCGLEVLGACPTRPEDGLTGARGLALIGPSASFWDVFSASPEMSDKTPDPLDRWSTRVLGQVAAQTGARALFPFDGPPWHPFVEWAQRTGRVWASPVNLLVHETHGLMTSFRGALTLADPVPVSRQTSPCDSCTDQPCRTACPVTALDPTGYDVPLCRSHLKTDAGSACLSGCLVRRACPVGQGLRSTAQSAFHMAAFQRSA
ncbi:MAG: ferredoxin [Pseudomonadota bacterium]